MKRTLDLLLALLLSPFGAVLILVLGIAVRSGSPGPAIFRQTRVGRHEVPFVCLKLRTMRIGTVDAPTHEIGASQITPIGAILRRTKLDELPQLWNIIVGDMSFVGPRPCLPSQHLLIGERRQRGLFTLRPGITGVAQIAGIDMSDPVRLAEADAAYLDRISVAGDLRLMLATVLGAGRGDRVDETR